MTTNNALITSALNKSLTIKTLDDLVRVRTSEVRFLVCDASSSMNCLMRNDQRRIDGLKEVVRQVKEKAAVRLVVFDGNGARLVDNTVTEPYGGTPLHEGIRMAKLHGASSCVVISDGEPDSETRAMEAAREFGGRIDVVFVGSEGDYGRLFLRRLAESTGGTESTGDLADSGATSGAIIGLLSSGAEEQKTVINLGAPVSDEDDEDDEDNEDNVPGFGEGED